jgi:hypothetical protein
VEVVRSLEGAISSKPLRLCGVLVALLAQSVKLSDSIIEGLLSQVASLVRGVEDLIVENGEVESETKADGVGGRKLSLGNFSSSLVGLEGLVGRVLAAIANGELGEVTVVVTLHLVVENLGLARLGGGDQVLVKDLEDIFADLGKLGLDLLSVLLDEGDLRRVALRLLLLLDGGDYAPGSTAGANDVLVGNGEKVSLLNGEISVLTGDNLHVLNHLCDRRAPFVSAWETDEIDLENIPSYRSACSASLAR